MIRDIRNLYRNREHFATDPYGKKGKLPAAFENVCREIYNKSGEEITFKNVHPEKHRHFFYGKPPSHWEVITCKPEEWCFLPHGMYTAHVPSGSQEIQVIVNFGDEMFKGNKLPSRPDPKPLRFFMKK